jgi:hypothetical protein
MCDLQAGDRARRLHYVERNSGRLECAAEFGIATLLAASAPDVRRVERRRSAWRETARAAYLGALKMENPRIQIAVTPITRHRHLKRWTLPALAVALPLLALVGAFTSPDTSRATASADDRPGSLAVYQRIDATVDCGELQRLFDIADRNHGQTTSYRQRGWTLAYMAAADKRMNDVGCHG